MDVKQIEQTIRDLAPWHHDIELNCGISTGRVFSPTGTRERHENQGVSLLSPRKRFLGMVDALYPRGCNDVSFLDCGCNAGGYCFWITERGCSNAVGVEARQHWLDQAAFVKKHRESVDGVRFQIADLSTVGFSESFDLTLFSGIFYHLPDPVAVLRKVAAVTNDILIVNTVARDDNSPRGLTMKNESIAEVMSGVDGLSWIPNNAQTVSGILRSCGFKSAKLHWMRTLEPGLARIEVVAAKSGVGRLGAISGEVLHACE